ncbi:MAG: hypothetical protein LIV11_02540 [Bacillota bacterium]|nr:hypothetical protein [Bacillota bacterium]
MENENGKWIMHGVKWDDPQCLHTVQDAINYINEIGFLPLFKNDIPRIPPKSEPERRVLWLAHRHIFKAGVCLGV